jgi:hypothetical protein
MDTSNFVPQESVTYWNRQDQLLAEFNRQIDHPETRIKIKPTIRHFKVALKEKKLSEFLAGLVDLMPAELLQPLDDLFTSKISANWSEELVTARAFQYFDHPDCCPRMEFQFDLISTGNHTTYREVRPSFILTLKFVRVPIPENTEDEGAAWFGLRAIELGRSFDGLQPVENNTLVEIPSNRIYGMQQIPEMKGWIERLASKAPYKGTMDLGDALRFVSTTGNKVYNAVVERFGDERHIWGVVSSRVTRTNPDGGVDALRIYDMTNPREHFFIHVITTPEGPTMGAYCATAPELFAEEDRLSGADPTFEPSAKYVQDPLGLLAMPGAQNYHERPESAGSDNATARDLVQYDDLLAGMTSFTMYLVKMEQAKFFFDELFRHGNLPLYNAIQSAFKSNETEAPATTPGFFELCVVGNWNEKLGGDIDATITLNYYLGPQNGTNGKHNIAYAIAGLMAM